MSGPCLSSSVTDRPLRPATRRRLGEPLPHQLADRPRAHLEATAYAIFDPKTICGINPSFPGLSPTSRQVTHVLLTRPPLEISKASSKDFPFDLHVLSTPPAFVLSQNQTLRRNVLNLTLNIKLPCLPFQINQRFGHSALSYQIDFGLEISRFPGRA